MQLAATQSLETLVLRATTVQRLATWLVTAQTLHLCATCAMKVATSAGTAPTLMVVLDARPATTAPSLDTWPVTARILTVPAMFATSLDTSAVTAQKARVLRILTKASDLEQHLRCKETAYMKCGRVLHFCVVQDCLHGRSTDLYFCNVKLIFLH